MLNSKLISFEERQLSKEQILKAMVDKICSVFQYKNYSDSLLNLVIEREKESTTTYPTGIAIPHVRLDGLDDTIISICIPHKPVMDNEQEVRLFVLILTDKNVSSLYLNVVSAFMRVSKDTELFTKLLAAGDANTFLNLIKKADVKIKDEVTVSDIMTSDILVINENESIKSLAELLNKYNIHYLPVVNDKREWVGEVNLLQYLKIALPDYMLMMNNVNFLRSYEPFSQLYKLEEEKQVKQVMTRPEKVLHPDFPVIEAVFEMTRQNRLTLPVVKDKQIIGIVTAMDIYRRVVRA
jgi:PTS system nitrogen regulatory IIA component